MTAAATPAGTARPRPARGAPARRVRRRGGPEAACRRSRTAPWAQDCAWRRSSPPMSGPAKGFAVHHLWATRRASRVRADLGPRLCRGGPLSVDHRDAPGRELVRARGHGLLRARSRGPSEYRSASPSTTIGPTESWALRKAFADDRPVPRVPGSNLHPFRPGHRRRRVPGPRGARARRHHRARALPLRRGRRAGVCTCSSGSSTSTRASRSASSSCRGATVCSWPSPSPATPRWGTRWPTRMPSSGCWASTVPQRARYLRMVLLELERLYNHIADIGALATDVAFTVPASRAQVLREGLVPLQERLFGTRLLRGTIALGGVKRDLTPGAPRRCCCTHLGPVRTRVRRPDHAADRRGHLHRSRRRHRHSRRTRPPAISAIVGMAARASGVDCGLPARPSARRLRRLAVRGPGRRRRATCARGSWCGRGRSSSRCRILHQVLERSARTRRGGAAARRAARRFVGSRVGGSVARDRAPIGSRPTSAGDVARVKVTDPSFLNWPGLVQAVPGNIIPDFPVINKSFNLSYSGNDR